MGTLISQSLADLPGGLVVRIRRSHRRGRGSIPRLGITFNDKIVKLALCQYTLFKMNLGFIFIVVNQLFLSF